jgi:hypothetical protein
MHFVTGDIGVIVYKNVVLNGYSVGEVEHAMQECSREIGVQKHAQIMMGAQKHDGSGGHA